MILAQKNASSHGKDDVAISASRERQDEREGETERERERGREREREMRSRQSTSLVKDSSSHAAPRCHGNVNVSISAV